MEAKEPVRVIGNGGLRGTIEPSAFANTAEERMVLRLETGQELRVHRNTLIRQEDGAYHLPLNLMELERLSLQESSNQHQNRSGESAETRVIPVIAEHLDVQKTWTDTGGVRVTKTVREQEEQIDIPIVREELTVERIPLNRIVDGPIPTREEGDTTILSVLKEVLVVEKRLILTEEVRITRKKTVTQQHESVTVRHEEVAVERLPASETVTQART